MRRSVTVTWSAAAAVAVLLAAGCSRGGGDDDGDLPDAAGLMTAAADEMAQVETVAMLLESDTDLGGLAVRRVDGVLTQAGDADGVALVEQLGTQVELKFRVVGETFYYQLIGGWQQQPLAEAADYYDPSAILDPDRGIAQLLRSATDPQVERRDGDQYEVTATFPAEQLDVVLPGAQETRGTVWIGVDRPLLHRAQFPVEEGTVTVTLSKFDEPVTIVAP
ncbi:MAG TPA: LppX_LprAFG lipoprotein [Natronosporangium sp.]